MKTLILLKQVLIIVLLSGILLLSITCKKDTNPSPDSSDTAYFHPTGLVEDTYDNLQSIPLAGTIDAAVIPNLRGFKSMSDSVVLDVPTPGNQGGYNSCVSWAIGYGLLSYHFKVFEGHSDYAAYNKIFSQDYIWHQLNGGKNVGIGIYFGLSLVQGEGCCKYLDMPVSNDFSLQPTPQARTNAANYKLTSFYRINNDIDEIKLWINRGFPIVIGMEVDDAFRTIAGESQFEKKEDGRLVWKKYTDDARDRHALLICGFDDKIKAFKVLNSYGQKWGNKGYIWIDYTFFRQAVIDVLTIPSIYVGVIKRPYLTTGNTTEISAYEALCSGSVLSDWGNTVTERGVCWSTSSDPTIVNNKKTIGLGTGSFSIKLTGLTANTRYYVKAFAVNSEGISYGLENSFTTFKEAITKVTDADGNVYPVVTIGSQEWMAENLKTTKYNDGTAIPLVTGSLAWSALTTPGYCWYNNDISYKNAFGALYNGYVVNTAKLAPVGWHVPTDNEWKQLEIALGMTQAKADEGGWRGTDQGTQLKSTSEWNSNGNGTNTSGFSALPGGFRYYSGNFGTFGNDGYWWSATDYSPTVAWHRGLFYLNANVSRSSYLKTSGFSVRCVRD